MVYTKIVRVELAAHAHATEDPDKVQKALMNIVPEELRDRVAIEKSILEGHYNNPIVRIVAKLEGRDAETFVKRLGEMLNEQDRGLLDALFDTRYDERTGRLFIRFSKQDAYMGELRLHDGDDVIHVVIQLRGSPKARRAREILHEAGLLG